ncbi:MAG TPA: hypothetical protein ACFYD2_04225 [Candidatus Avalokitesvara rifleensis]|uniref:hypothetical protein n=1 Tax=Candidatus Avalokitesvara rifleensis TaxID=3367620 RepID=UPI0040267066
MKKAEQDWRNKVAGGLGLSALLFKISYLFTIETTEEKKKEKKLLKGLAKFCDSLSRFLKRPGKNKHC